MGRLDTETLLQEVSTESPCGDDLEYDPDFGELERTARGKPERVMGSEVVPGEDADWTDVENRAIELLSRTKDLRVGVYLTRSQLHTEGLAGFADGLGLLRRMLEDYWETVYPLLDAEDDNDPTFRINTITTLCDADTVLRALHEVPLIMSRNFGPVTYRDLAIASGDLSPAPGAEVMGSATIGAALQDGDPDQLRASCEGAEAAVQHVVAIEQYITDQVGAAQAPNLETLRRLVEAIHKALAPRVTGADGKTTVAGNGHDGAGFTAPAQGAGQRSGGASLSGDIQSRDDVVRAIDKICEYYTRHEPSSPIPMLLQRAKGLVTKSFLEIVQNLTPDGLSQAEVLRGPEEGGGGSTSDSGDGWGSSDDGWGSSDGEETVE